ncbi:MAG TPA: tRNA threonylcarbamoyladenosine dehydratase [Rectinemataceae bacterium]|nr:tRNA threonylcarbamoyladenosine dehydratase [Rectinemataceae bacterium]
MLDSFSRTELLLGAEAMKSLAAARVAVFGIGGVGAYVVEGLARSGVGSFILVDDDSVCLTNINRQIIALRSTVGKPKVEVMKARVLDINPQAEVAIFQEYCDAENIPRLLGQDTPGKPAVSYVVDAIDTVSSKIELIMRASALGIPIISCMGAGNKLDPTKLEIADIYDTSVCPLARVMRYELRKRGLAALDVVYSKEIPIKVEESENPCRTGCVCPKKDRTCLGRRSIPGSVSFVPSVAGLIIASHVVRKLVGRG